MTLTQLYLFMVVLPNLHELATGPSIILVIMVIIIGAVAYWAATLEGIPVAEKLRDRCLKISFFVLGLFAFLATITPSDRQLYTLAGGYVATNTKDVSKLPDNLVRAANAWLEKAADAAKDAPKEKSLDEGRGR